MECQLIILELQKFFCGNKRHQKQTPLLRLEMFATASNVLTINTMDCLTSINNTHHQSTVLIALVEALLFSSFVPSVFFRCLSQPSLIEFDAYDVP